MDEGLLTHMVTHISGGFNWTIVDMNERSIQ